MATIAYWKVSHYVDGEWHLWSEHPTAALARDEYEHAKRLNPGVRFAYSGVLHG